MGVRLAGGLEAAQHSGYSTVWPERGCVAAAGPRHRDDVGELRRRERVVCAAEERRAVRVDVCDRDRAIDVVLVGSNRPARHSVRGRDRMGIRERCGRQGRGRAREKRDTGCVDDSDDRDADRGLQSRRRGAEQRAAREPARERGVLCDVCWATVRVDGRDRVSAAREISAGGAAVELGLGGAGQACLAHRSYFLKLHRFLLLLNIIFRNKTLQGLRSQVRSPL